MISLFFNLLLSLSEGGMSYMLMMIQSLQLILNYPFVSVIFPGNVMMVYSITIPIIMFDVLEGDWNVHEVNLNPNKLI